MACMAFEMDRVPWLKQQHGLTKPVATPRLAPFLSVWPTSRASMRLRLGRIASERPGEARRHTTTRASLSHESHTATPRASTEHAGPAPGCPPLALTTLVCVASAIDPTQHDSL